LIIGVITKFLSVCNTFSFLFILSMALENFSQKPYATF